MVDRIKTAVTVVLLTCLIWFVADQFNQASLDRGVKVRITTQADGDLIILGPPVEPELRVRLSGPNRLIRQLEVVLKAGRALTYVLPEETTVGAHSIAMRRALSESEELAGLAVKQVEPDQVEVTVDRLVWRDAVVELETGPYGGAAEVIEPKRVRVRLPESVLGGPASPELTVTADLRNLLADQPVDKIIELREVAVTGDDALGVRQIQPDRVNVQLKISGRRKKLKGVVVYFNASQAVLGKYAPETTNDVVDVDVVGPRHLISALEPQDVDARVSVSMDDYRPDMQTVRRQVEFEFPSGVELDQEPPVIEFRLVERPASAAAG